MPDTKVVFEESQAGLNSAKLKTITEERLRRLERQSDESQDK